MTPADVRVFRKVLLLVQELHLRGYQRIRIAPGMSPSGMNWRCPITPVSNILRSHGARMRDFDGLVAHYGSGAGRDYFDWTDARHATPSRLAAKESPHSHRIPSGRATPRDAHTSPTCDVGKSYGGSASVS